MTSAEETGVVTLTIPCAPEYVGTARLTILGVAGRMGFSYDQVEDIRLAVGEACTNAIDRAGRKNGASDAATITIRSHVEAAQLIVEVEDTGAGQGAAAAQSPNPDVPLADTSELDKQELGALLMEILVDEVSVEAAAGGGTRVRLVKYAAES